MASKILNFSPNRLITGINIVDNMLFYTDGENEPKKINIEKFRGKATTGEFKDIPVDHSSGNTHIYNRPFEERDITVIKDHPSTSGKKTETIVLNENFGSGGGDLVIDDVLNDSDFEVIVDDNAKAEDPSSGIVDILIEGNSLDGIQLISETKHGKGVVEESGFIWSMTAETLDELIQGIESGDAYQVSSSDVEADNNVTKGNYAIVKTDTTSPDYDANLTTGDLYAVAFTKLKGQNKKVYSPIIEVEILDNNASTTVASEIKSIAPIRIPDSEKFQWKSIVKNTGGSPPDAVGIYISQPRINTNETAPTVQELIDKGSIIPGEFINNEIIVEDYPLPNKYYYWVPYIKNKNGVTYGDSLSTSSTVPNIFKTNGFVKPVIKTLNVTESNPSGDVFLRTFYEGDKSSVVNGSEEATEIGFYFSKEESKAFDILNKTYTGNVSTDGSSYKVPISGYDFENGGSAKLNINDYIDLKPEESVYYFTYIINSAGETVSDIKEFELPKVPEKPNFYISNLDWKLKPNSTDDNGIKDTILLDYDLDVTDIDETLNIDDIGIIVSRPSTSDEIKQSSNGVWTTKDQIINSSNSISTKVSERDLTFSANGGSTKIGRYENTNPIEIENINFSEYYNLLNEGIKPQNENWSAVGYIVVDGVTYYTNPANRFSDISNKNTTVKPNIIGGPRVFTNNIQSESFTNLAHNSVKLKGKLHNYGKDLSDVGFYISSTPPFSNSNTQVASIGNDGRSSDLDTWAASATKHSATDITLTDANNHLNQSTNDFLNFEADVTGLTAETKYYIAAFSNPVQTVNSNNDKTVNNSESLNKVINDKKWGSVFSFTTPKDATVVTTATPPPLVEAIGLERRGSAKYFDKTRAFLGGELIMRSKDYSVTTKGYYLKAASEFPNPFSDQAGNAATMADPTNRSTFIDSDTRVIRLNSKHGTFTTGYGYKSVPIDTIDYYYSFFVVVNETGETFISDYKLIDNSKNAAAVVPEVQSFQLTPPVLTGTSLSNSSSNYGSDTNNGISGSIVWDKETNVAGIPQIESVGAYYINKQGGTKPSNVNDFLNAFNSTGGQSGWTTSSKELTEREINFSSDGKTATYTIPLPSNAFPSTNAGKTFYAIGFIRYDDGTFKYSNTVEEFVIPSQKALSSSIDIIYYGNTNNYVAEVTKNGLSVLTPEQRELAFYGSYNPPYIEAKISYPNDWFIFGQFIERIYANTYFTRTKYLSGLNPALKVTKVGNTIRFPSHYKGYSSTTVYNKDHNFWIIPEYKRQAFTAAISKSYHGSGTKNFYNWAAGEVMAILEDFSVGVIKTKFGNNFPDNRV